jgi:hypothetical protein
MMGAQVGIYSAYQLGLHNHLNDDQGGVLNEYSRFGAFREAYRTGALLVHVDNDAEQSEADHGVYWLTKQFTVNTAQRGEWRIYFEMANADNMTNVFARFYVNGVAVGAVQARNLNTYAPKTDNYDVDLAAGDLLQIYTLGNGDSVFVRNFRIYYDWAIKYFHDGTNGRVLTTPLVLADVAALDVTADF